MIGREDFYRRTDLTGHTVTDPSAATDYPATRMRDDKDYIFWKAGGTGTLNYDLDLGVGNDLAADFIAIISHNFGTEGVSWEYLSGASNPASDSVIAAVSPSNDRIQCRAFDGATARRYHRIQLTNVTADTIIGEVLLGRRIDFPYGVDPGIGFDPIAEVPRNRASRSENGNIIRTTSDFSERTSSWQFKMLANTFVGDETAPTGGVPGFRWWWDNYGSKMGPSVFSWNPGNPGDFERDAIWGVADGSVSRPLATQLDTGFRDVMFNIIGLKED